MYRSKNIIIIEQDQRGEPPGEFLVCIVSFHLFYQLDTGGHTQKEQPVDTSWGPTEINHLAKYTAQETYRNK